MLGDREQISSLLGEIITRSSRTYSMLCMLKMMTNFCTLYF